MIIEFNKKYEKEVKKLLEELQNYIVEIDQEKYNIISEDYKEKYYKKTMEEIEKCNGKILLAKEKNQIVGLVVGLINNNEIEESGFKAPKRGRISELIVSKSYRGKSLGKELLNEIEKYLKQVGCQDILIGVFAYNENAKKFYEKNGYHTRMIEMTKKI